MDTIDVERRQPTGALRFGADWPGVFMRGDEALAAASVLERIGEDYGVPSSDGSWLRGLINTLRSCRSD